MGGIFVITHTPEINAEMKKKIKHPMHYLIM